MKLLKSRISSAIFCGVLISILNNITYISSLYNCYSNWIYYLLTVLIALLVVIMIKGKTKKDMFSSVGIMILSNFFTEIILLVLGISNYFYYIVNPSATEVSMGASFIQLIIYIFGYIGVITGIVFVFLFAKIKKFLHGRDKQKDKRGVVHKS